MLCTGWRCGGVKVLSLFGVFSSMCISSVSPRFYFRRLAFSFLPLAAILESLFLFFLRSCHAVFYHGYTNWIWEMSVQVLCSVFSWVICFLAIGVPYRFWILFIRSIVWKYFLTFCTSSLHFLNCFFCSKFDVIPFVYVCFCCMCFQGHIQKSLFRPTWAFSHCFQ
jgi:hypothetical protein